MLDVAVTYIVRTSGGVPEVLLGEKLTGLGIGHIVGPGGKAEPGESPADAAIREVFEEVGLVLEADDLVPIARISYPFLGREWLSQRSFVFTCASFVGSPRASGELAASWWPLSQIPYDRMWSDASLWLPQALSGKFVEATIVIGESNEVVSHEFLGS